MTPVPVKDTAISHVRARYAGSRLKVVMRRALAVNGRWSYWRADFEFGKHPVEITLDQLGEEIDEAIETIILLVGEENLCVTLVQQDGTEQVLGAAETVTMQAELAAVRAALNRCGHCGRSIG